MMCRRTYRPLQIWMIVGNDVIFVQVYISVLLGDATAEMA